MASSKSEPFLSAPDSCAGTRRGSGHGRAHAPRLMELDMRSQQGAHLGVVKETSDHWGTVRGQLFSSASVSNLVPASRLAWLECVSPEARLEPYMDAGDGGGGGGDGGGGSGGGGGNRSAVWKEQPAAQSHVRRRFVPSGSPAVRAP